MGLVNKRMKIPKHDENNLMVKQINPFFNLFSSRLSPRLKTNYRIYFIFFERYVNQIRGY